MVSKDVYAVILAGGSGTRFWPKSRQRRPKQLCIIGGGKKTMIEKTLARLDGLIPPDRRLIVTHQDQIAATKKIVKKRCAHYLAEPQAKNTAAALALAALEIQGLSKGFSSPVMISLHADHLIKNENLFREELERAVAIARGGYLTLLGVKPTYPETGYGYIEQGKPITGELNRFNGFHVASFREKPELSIAKDYVREGRFYWNSGYFVWQISTILEELAQYLPDTLKQLQGLLQKEKRQSFTKVPSKKLAATYKKLNAIAIDHAVLEKSAKAAVIATDFGWFDVGSWDALAQCVPTDQEGNLLNGDVLAIDSKNITVDSDGAFIACLGVQDLVVVSANGAILVCPKSKTQDVKKIVESLKARGRKELL